MKKLKIKEPNISDKKIQKLSAMFPLPAVEICENKDYALGNIKEIFFFRTERARQNFQNHVDKNDIPKIKRMIYRKSIIKIK